MGAIKSSDAGISVKVVAIAPGSSGEHGAKSFWLVWEGSAGTEASIRLKWVATCTLRMGSYWDSLTTISRSAPLYLQLIDRHDLLKLIQFSRFIFY